MTLTINTIEHPIKKGLAIESVFVEDANTLRELRASDWVEGQLKLLTFPKRVVGYVGGEPPISLSGDVLHVGDTLIKGPAGDLAVLVGAA